MELLNQESVINKSLLIFTTSTDLTTILYGLVSHVNIIIMCYSNTMYTVDVTASYQSENSLQCTVQQATWGSVENVTTTALCGHCRL